MADKNRKQKKWNFVDVILLIFIIGVVGGLIYLFVSPYTNQIVSSANTVDITYKIKVEGVSDEIKYKIEEGDNVVEAVDLTNIGKVQSVEFSPTEYVGVDKNGNSVVGTHPGEQNILITVKAQASSTSGTFVIGDYSIAAGKVVSFRVPGFSGEGECIYVGEASK